MEVVKMHCAASGGAQGSLGLLLLLFEDEELTSLNGHTTSS